MSIEHIQDDNLVIKLYHFYYQGLSKVECSYTHEIAENLSCNHCNHDVI